MNGLGFYDLDYAQFGMPARISATSAVGRSGVVNIEREASPWEQLFMGMSQQASTAAMLRAIAPMAPGLQRSTAERIEAELAWLKPDADGRPVRAIVHCFCGL